MSAQSSGSQSSKTKMAAKAIVDDDEILLLCSFFYSFSEITACISCVTSGPWVNFSKRFISIGHETDGL